MKKKIHEPYNKFKGFLREKGLTYLDVSNTLEISQAAVANKINGISDFYIGEIEILQSKYGVETSIFFNLDIANLITNERVS